MDALELPEQCLEMAAVYQSLEIANFFSAAAQFQTPHCKGNSK